MDGEVAYINLHSGNLINMLPKETTNQCQRYQRTRCCSNPGKGIANQIFTSSCLERTLEPDAPFTCANDTEMVSELLQYILS